MTGIQGFATLRDRTFAWFFAGRAASLLGHAIVSVPLAFAALAIGGSALSLGIVLGARTTAYCVFVLFGGVISDRFDRVRILRLAHIATAVTQGLAAALILSGRAEIWMIAVIEAANGAVTAFTGPALTGLLPSLVAKDQLQSANALLELTKSLSGISGPAIGGLLFLTIGAGWALAIDSGAYLIAYWCLGRMRRRTGSIPLDSDKETLVESLREGWDEFRSRTWLWIVVADFLVINAISVGAVFVLGPVVAKADLGPGTWGLVLTLEAIGLTVANLALVNHKVGRPLRAAMLGITLCAGPMIALGARAGVVLLFVAFFLSGVGIAINQVCWNAAMQAQIPGDVISRVSSFDYLGSYVAMPLGQIGYGLLSERVDPHPLLLGSAAVFVIAALAALLSRSVRTLRSA